ncbi:MAG: ATP-binding protein, partial [Candidatus Zixiibacteriota bacterium]
MATESSKPESAVRWESESADSLAASRRGLAVVGWIGLCAPLLLVGSRIVSGMRPGWRDIPGVQMGVQDELAVTFLGGLCLVLSRSRMGIRHARWCAAALVLLAAAVIIQDDAVRGVDTSARYLALLLLILVGVMPFPALGMAALGTGLILVHFVLTYIVPVVSGRPTVWAIDNASFLLVMALLAAWVSGVVYRTRGRETRAHADVVAAKERYASLFHDAYEAIFVIDNKTGHFLEVNPILAELLGMSPDDLSRTPFWELVHPDDRRRVLDYYNSRRIGEDSPTRYTARMLSRRHSDPRLVDITIHRTRDPSMTAGVAHDITELVQATDAARIYALELEETNRLLKGAQLQLVQTGRMAAQCDLVAGLAHEINSPLATVASGTDISVRAVGILKRALGASEAATAQVEIVRALHCLEEASGTSQRAVERIDQIVKALRSFVRLDESEWKIVDLHAGLDATIKLLESKLQVGVRIIRDYGAIEPIACSPGQINQVLWNLLDNAIRAVGERGEVTIRTRQENQDIELSVSDTGPGIPEAQLQHIFDPNFTIRGERVAMGLGLPVANRIVRAHGGTISIKSQPGEGTCVTVRLPVNADPAIR